MALKYPSFLDGSLESYSNETQRDLDRVGLDTKTCGATLLDEPVLPTLAEPPHRRIQPEQFENDDYQIALVARKNSTDRTGSFLQPSATADRFLILPFTWRELLDRVRRETNHSNSVRQSLIMRFGDVRVDFLTMEISRSEKPIALTPQAFKLLRFFTRSPERVISRDELLNEVWGYNNYPSTRTVDNHIRMLRQKLELNPARPIHFLTVNRMGYKFLP
jgi:DNA-binding response OmpR family regulator